MEKKQRTARSLLNRLSSSSFTALSAALAEIRLLTKHDPEIRPVLLDSGVLLPILTHLLLLHDDELDGVQENACAILLNLSISAAEALMSTPSLLPAIARALNSRNNPLLPQHAAATLFSLLSVDAYRPIIGSKPDIISSLLSLLRSPASSARTLKDSLKALFGLALYPLNRASLLDLGAAPVLLSIVVTDRRVGVLEDATAVIAQVAGCFECVESFRRVGGVRILVGLLQMGDDHGGNMSERVRENAASALLNLAMSGGEKAVGDIREVEMAEEAVRGLAERGSTERARMKAEGLLRVLGSGRGSSSFLLHRFIAQFDDHSGSITESSSAMSSSSVDSTSTSY